MVRPRRVQNAGLAEEVIDFAAFYLKGTLQIRVEARTLQQVKETLNNWTRLKIPVDDVLAFQKVSKSFIGCTVDDVQYRSDGKSFTINGKRMEYI